MNRVERQRQCHCSQPLSFVLNKWNQNVVFWRAFIDVWLRMRWQKWCTRLWELETKSNKWVKSIDGVDCIAIRIEKQNSRNSTATWSAHDDSTVQQRHTHTPALLDKYISATANRFANKRSRAHIRFVLFTFLSLSLFSCFAHSNHFPRFLIEIWNWKMKCGKSPFPHSYAHVCAFKS